MLRLKKHQTNEHYDTRKNKRQRLDNEQISSSTNLQQCLICNRHFTDNRLIERQRVCEQSKKLHYHYDSQLHRWKGLDYHISTNQSNANRNKIQSLTKHFPETHWREKHQQFQNVVKGQYNPTNDRPYQCSQCQRKVATENAIIKHQKGFTGKRQMNVKSRDLKKKKK